MANRSAVDLWYVRTGDVREAATVRACAALLTPEEVVQQAAFVFEQNRHEYLVTRALGRAALASRLGTAPSELAFARNEHGRPELFPPSTCRFNLTNTVHFVACAITEAREVGVDAEPLTRGAQILQVAETVFTSGERAMLAALSMNARLRRAVELWTLKEAYIKARGLGMSLPVERIEMSFADDPTRAPRVRFFPPVADEPARWQFVTWELHDHLVSLCVEVESALERPEISIHRADLGAMIGSRLRKKQ